MTPVSAHRYLPRYQCKVMIQASAHRYLPKYRRQQCKDWKELKWEKVDFVHITRDLFCLKISFQLKPSFFRSFSLSLSLSFSSFSISWFIQNLSLQKTFIDILWQAKGHRRTKGEKTMSGIMLKTEMKTQESK